MKTKTVRTSILAAVVVILGILFPGTQVQAGVLVDEPRTQIQMPDTPLREAVARVQNQITSFSADDIQEAVPSLKSRTMRTEYDEQGRMIRKFLPGGQITLYKYLENEVLEIQIQNERVISITGKETTCLKRFNSMNA